MQRSATLMSLSDTESALHGTDESAKKRAALDYLELEENSFNRIHTKELKLETLQYRLGRKEFDILANRSLDDPLIQRKLILATLAWQTLIQSSLITQHRSDYSPFSQGLHKLRTRTVYTSTTDDVNDAMSRSVMNDGAINSGVEPKFRAILIKDPILHLMKEYPDATARWQFIAKYNGDIKRIAALFKEHLPTYVLKLTYPVLDRNNNVIPSAADLERSNTMQNLRQKLPVGFTVVLKTYQILKTRHIDDVNVEAVLEVLANDVARTFGMTVQSQELYPAQFQNAVSQLLLLGRWLTGSSTLGGDSGAALTGGVAGDGCLAKPVLLPHQDIHHVSDASIAHLGEHLPLLLVQGDRDAIGSQGQNKLRVGNTLVGIDFGKAYQQSIVEQVTSQFQIGNEAIRKEFKNYSIFDDTTRSEKMRGVIRLARLKGEVIAPAILASYGDDFKEQIYDLVPNADVSVFDDYLQYFTEIKQEFQGQDKLSKSNLVFCDKIIAAVTQARMRAIEARDQMIDKFRHYLQLPAQAVNLLENMERVMAGNTGTTLRSPDRHVLLQHLKQINPPVTHWNISIDKACYVCEASFKDAATAESAHRKLLAWNTLQSKGKSALGTTLSGNKLTVTFAQNKLAEISACFEEELIKKHQHPVDYQLQLNYQQEASLQALLSQLGRFNASATLGRHPSKDHYVLTIKPMPNQVITPALIKELEYYRLYDAKTTLPCEFKRNQLQTIMTNLNNALNKASMEVSIKNQMERFEKQNDSIRSTLQLIAMQSCLRLTRQYNEFQLDILIDNEVFKEMLFARLPFQKRGKGMLVPWDKLEDMNGILAACQQAYAARKAEMERHLDTFNTLSAGYQSTFFKNTRVPALELKSLSTGSFSLKVNSTNALFFDCVCKRLSAAGISRQQSTFNIPFDNLALLNESLTTALNDYQQVMMQKRQLSSVFEGLTVPISGLLPAKALKLDFQKETGLFSVSFDPQDVDAAIVSLMVEQYRFAKSNALTRNINFAELSAFNDAFKQCISACLAKRAVAARLLKALTLETPPAPTLTPAPTPVLACDEDIKRFEKFKRLLANHPDIRDSLSIDLRPDEHFSHFTLVLRANGCDERLIENLKLSLASFRQGDQYVVKKDELIQLNLALIDFLDQLTNLSSSVLQAKRPA